MLRPQLAMGFRVSFGFLRFMFPWCFSALACSGGVVVSLLDVGFLLDFVLLDAKSYHARFVTLMATGTC